MNEKFVQLMKADLLRWEDPLSVKAIIRLVLSQPGAQLAVSIRLQRAVNDVPLVGRVFARIFWYFTVILLGADIPTSASLGGGVYFPHPHGIVIGASAKIGRNVSILQNVTIGNRGPGGVGDPRIEDNVSLSAGAAILGSVVIGQDALVGANAVVLTDVPAGCVAVGVPARVLARPVG